MQTNASQNSFSQPSLSPDMPRARQKKYEALALQAIEEHRFWDMLWAELARDYNATLMNILQMWRSVDTHFREHHPLH